MNDIQKCYKCGTQPELYGHNNESGFKIKCLTCDSIVKGTSLDFTIDTWNKFNLEKAVEEKYEEARRMILDEPIILKRAPKAMKCAACNEYPKLHYYPKLKPNKFSYYEFTCETCHISSGRHANFEFAEKRWEEINAPRKEEMVYDHDALPKCQECGQHPAVNKYSSSCDEGYYEVGCAKCQRWSGPQPTRVLAEKIWCEMNPVTNTTIPDIMRGKRVNSCKVCEQEVQIRYDKERRAYEIECLKCKNGVIAQKIENVIYGWNELNPKIVRSGLRTGRYPWTYENSKVIATKNDPPKARGLFCNERIAELSHAISNRLVWIHEVEKASAIYPLADDWCAIEDWAIELAEYARHKKEIQNG